MFRGLLVVLVVTVSWLGGWIVGSVHPAPPALVQRINPQAWEAQTVERLRDIGWTNLSAALGDQQYEALKREIVYTAAHSGDLIVVDRDDAHMEASDASDAPVAPAPVAPAETAPLAAFDSAIRLCPRMTVSNAPRADAASVAAGIPPVVDVNGVALAVDPTDGACLSSGFGPRSGRTHKGVDFHSADGGPILAAANGTILEMKYRDDYGNMLLIDHGEGVYTRYAHLSSFQKGLKIGARVRAGERIGLMGNTAGYRVPVHLHYELLLGEYDNPKASFGLTPDNPFRFAAFKG